MPRVRVSDPLGTPDMPDTATWPRLMTGKHPRAAGSYGPAALDWALARPLLNLKPMTAARWWQELALRRALEHDGDGQLLWQTVMVSAPRQTGKSYLERAVCAWRIHAGERFHGPQDLLHVAHKLHAAQEVWRPAARWAHAAYGRGAVRWANGEQQIELPDGSRWMIQAATDGAGVAFSLSMVLVDEAWRVARHVVDGALLPTMAEAEQPQLWLVSTAGTSQSDLMMAYRALALALAEPAATDTLLLLEWSAPPDPDLDIDDPVVWRNASPHWDARREQRVRKARGETTEVQFRQQWLNQWVPTVSVPVFTREQWRAAEWMQQLPGGPVAFGVDVAQDRSHAVILTYVSGVAELVDERPGAAWVAGRLVELTERWHPVGIGVDGTGPAATVADQLSGTVAADRLVVLSGREMASACGQLFDAITEGRLAARPHQLLDAAVLNAHKRPYGQAWVFSRQSGDVSGVPLLALTAAVWAAEHAAVQVERSRIW